MKFFKLLSTILVSIFLLSNCGSQKVNSLKIQGKKVEAGTCILGAKTARQAVITTRSDCRLRGGAFAPDIDDITDESRAEML